MSQNMKNQPGEDQGDSGRGSNENQSSRRYEGFEGMNYEQRRPPYHPEHIGNRNQDGGDRGGNGTRRDEP